MSTAPQVAGQAAPSWGQKIFAFATVLLPAGGAVACLIYLLQATNPTAIMSTVAAVVLVAIKTGFVIMYGDPDLLPMAKCRTLGADLTFTAMTFDISMALSQVPVPYLGFTMRNPGWFYLTTGITNLFVWILWLFPQTVRNTKASEATIGWATAVGGLLYGFRIVLMILQLGSKPS